MARIVAELVTAGVEGGSKRAIEEEWGLADYRELLDCWRVTPPPHIALLHVGHALGVDWSQLARDDDEPPGDDAMAAARNADPLPVSEGSPSITELAKLIPSPVAGGDTLEASRALLRALQESPAP